MLDNSNMQPVIHSLISAAKGRLSKVHDGPEHLYKLGLPTADDAIRGLAAGEMAVVAARPSHGKTLVGLQWVYHLSQSGVPCLVCSEEMTIRSLANRFLQFATPVEEAKWAERSDKVWSDVEDMTRDMAPLFVTQGLRHAETIYDVIGTSVREYGIKFVMVDYLQLLHAEGGSRYEQVSNVSRIMKAAATDHNVALVVLAQLNRAVENSDSFSPEMHHLRDSGQIEQDADVCFLLQWPFMNERSGDKKRTPRGQGAPDKVDPQEFRIYARKNRNRGCDTRTIFLRIWPQRMKITEIDDAPHGQSNPKPKNYRSEFDDWNNR